MFYSRLKTIVTDIGTSITSITAEIATSQATLKGRSKMASSKIQQKINFKNANYRGLYGTPL